MYNSKLIYNYFSLVGNLRFGDKTKNTWTTRCQVNPSCNNANIYFLEYV